jgi:hypothetical protein
MGSKDHPKYQCHQRYAKMGSKDHPKYQCEVDVNEQKRTQSHHANYVLMTKVMQICGP